MEILGLELVPGKFASNSVVHCLVLMNGLDWLNINTEGESKIKQPNLQRRVFHWLVPSTGHLKSHPVKNCLSVDQLKEK